MEDGRSPPDADDTEAEARKGEPPRRTGLRLRDAEAVATTRLDMLSNGTLLDALTGRLEGSASPKEEQPPSDDDALPDATTPDEPRQAEPAAATDAEEPTSAESLDAIIDSFPAEPPGSEPEVESAPQADPSFLAASPFSFRNPSSDDDPGDAEQPRPALDRFQVSAIFQGLIQPDAETAQATAPEAPSEPGVEPGVTGEALVSPIATASDPDGDAAPATAIDTTDDAQADDGEGAAPPAASGGETPDSDQGPMIANPDAWPPFPEPPAGGATNPAPMMPHPSDWPPFPASPGSQAGAAPQTATDPSPASGSGRTPQLSDWPPFPEPPGAAGGAPQPDGDAPFLGTPAWPPYPELPGSVGTGSPTMAGLPPYIEVPAASSGDAEPSGFAAPDPDETTGRYAEDQPPFAPPPPGTAEPASPLGARNLPPSFTAPDTAQQHSAHADETGDEPDVTTGRAPRTAFDAAERASADATAKIAAEANATAQALDNLQRMLTQSLPGAEEPPPSLRAEAPLGSPHGAYQAAFDVSADRAAYPGDEPQPYLPLPVPPSADQGKRVYLLGFATGLVLSVVAGVALYVLIAIGN